MTLHVTQAGSTRKKGLAALRGRAAGLLRYSCAFFLLKGLLWLALLLLPLLR